MFSYIIGVGTIVVFFVACSYFIELNPPPKPGERRRFMYDILSDQFDYYPDKHDRYMDEDEIEYGYRRRVR